MDTCPNCEAPARAGARFCTTCGHRFSAVGEDAAAENLLAVGAPEPGPLLWPTGSWPSASADIIARASAGDWDRQEGGRAMAAEAWSGLAGAGWPAPQPTADPAAAADSPAHATNPEPEPAANETAAQTEDAVSPIDPPIQPAIARVNTLLGELNLLLAELAPAESPDLTGLVSELEVAVQPPGALSPDRVSAVRDLLLQARERPRDLDLIVGLAERLGEITDLLFAYERAIAAIERALTMLRPYARAEDEDFTDLAGTDVPLRGSIPESR